MSKGSQTIQSQCSHCIGHRLEQTVYGFLVNPETLFLSWPPCARMLQSRVANSLLRIQVQYTCTDQIRSNRGGGCSSSVWPRKMCTVHPWSPKPLACPRSQAPHQDLWHRQHGKHNQPSPLQLETKDTQVQIYSCPRGGLETRGSRYFLTQV